MSDIRYTQVPPPPHVASDPRAKLTSEEEAKYNDLFLHFSKDTFAIPGIETNPQLLEEEKFWLSRECLLRYLRASKWKTATAIQRLENTLKWRREFGIYDLLTPEHVEPEAVTGKEVVFGYDTDGRPGFYMFPSRQNTDEPTRQIQFAVWMLERCIDLMRPGVETVILLINYADKAKGPSMSTARAVLNILQDHYPERLGRSLIIKIPFYINAFFKIIMPFVDPITREKVKFNPEVVKDGYFTPDMLMNGSWEGSCNFEYVHDNYWPALVMLCDERKKAWLAKWRELGAKVGIKEWDYKKDTDIPESEFETDVALELLDDSGNGHIPPMAVQPFPDEVKTSENHCDRSAHHGHAVSGGEGYSGHTSGGGDGSGAAGAGAGSGGGSSSGGGEGGGGCSGGGGGDSGGGSSGGGDGGGGGCGGGD
ncbi:hypothetical protein AMATHDRAFT_150905 [Amanita thiersii Skay4041]|uniref:CRAL-TRIO domain-containing protein n=1 Tax=Amanita thiersii Skay4041 TaxID=703135 RepID=A0A2A9NI71_9AGAR|nr:hypothetical protein AMATHDRAFT_150905 [Amanita thiersii Skay4041]